MEVLHIFVELFIYNVKIISNLIILNFEFVRFWFVKFVKFLKIVVIFFY